MWLSPPTSDSDCKKKMAGRGGKQVNVGVFARGTDARKERDAIWKEKYYSRGWEGKLQKQRYGKEDWKARKEWELLQLPEDVKSGDAETDFEAARELRKFAEAEGIDIIKENRRIWDILEEKAMKEGSGFMKSIGRILQSAPSVIDK